MKDKKLTPAQQAIYEMMPDGHKPIGTGPLAQKEYKALGRAKAMGCTVSAGGWIHLPDHLHKPGQPAMFVDALDFADYLKTEDAK